MNTASTGFPWNKVQAARLYLLAMKPWLGPIAQRIVVVPVDHPPVGAHGWIVAPQTDRDGRLYLDRSFTQTQPLEVLAGALEHEYAKISRGVHSRLSWVDPENWDEIAAPAFQLEIMDAMEREKNFLTPLRIEQRLARSSLFTQYDYDDWGVQGPPSLTETGALSPARLGLPEGLSAETYAQLLLEARRQTSHIDLSNLVNGTNSSGSDSDGQHEAGETSPSESTEAGGQRGEPSAPSAGDAEGAGEADGGNVQHEADDGDESSDGDDQAASGVSEGDGDGGAPEVDDGAAGEGDEDLWAGLDLLGGSEEADAQPGPAGDPDSDVTGPKDAPLRSGVQEILEDMGGAQALEQARKEAMSDPDTYAWSKSIPHYDDEFSAQIAPPPEHNAPPVPASQLSQALNESATLTMQHASQPGSGVDVRTMQVAHRRLQSLGLSWERHLARVVSSCVTSERVRGASDLTYATPNPNQPEIGPRLMGMTDYAPRVTIIQDVSGSMYSSMSVAMDAMADLMVTLMGRLQARSQWVTVANGIVDVGEAATMSDDVRTQWLRGGGGTHLGDVIEGLMGGQGPVTFKGRRLEVPDLLVVSTDAQFQWPEKRPSRAHRLIVVIYQDSHREYLPDWVDQRSEVVLAAD